MIIYSNNATYTKWIDVCIELIGDLAHLPLPMAIQTARNAARTTLQDTKAWIHKQSFDSYDEETNIARVNSPKNADIFLIKNVFLNQRELTETEYNDSTEKPLNPYKYYLLSPNEFLFNENVRGVLNGSSMVNMTLIPSKTSDGIDVHILNALQETIRFKCLETIAKSPNPKLFNSEMAAYYRKEYEESKKHYLREPFILQKKPSVARYGGF